MIICSACNRELQITVKIKECLQIAYSVEKLGKPHTFIDVMASLHELRLDSPPDGYFQFRIDQFRWRPLVNALAQAAGLSSILDNAAKNRVARPLELLRPLLLTLVVLTHIPAVVGNKRKPHAHEYTNNSGECFTQKFDEPGTHCCGSAFICPAYAAA